MSAKMNVDEKIVIDLSKPTVKIRRFDAVEKLLLIDITAQSMRDAKIAKRAHCFVQVKGRKMKLEQARMLG